MRIELYHAYIDAADSALWERLWEQLPSARRVQLASRTPSARAEGAALSALLTHAITRWGCGNPFQTLPAAALTVPYPHWETAKNGKPFPAGIRTARGVAHVSFSHSGGHLLVAVCDRPLGADIQVQNAPALAPDRFRRLAARISHSAETPPATAQETARQFTAKEAILKLSGKGLRHAMSTVKTADFAVSFYDDVPDCVIAVAILPT